MLERQRFVENFKAGDVIHWKEAIWTDRSQRGRNQLAGEQEVTGQIESITEQSVNIKVVAAKIIDERLPESAKADLVAHPAGKTKRRNKELLDPGQKTPSY